MSGARAGWPTPTYSAAAAADCSECAAPNAVTRSTEVRPSPRALAQRLPWEFLPGRTAFPGRVRARRGRVLPRPERDGRLRGGPGEVRHRDRGGVRQPLHRAGSSPRAAPLFSAATACRLCGVPICSAGAGGVNGSAAPRSQASCNAYGYAVNSCAGKCFLHGPETADGLPVRTRATAQQQPRRADLNRGASSGLR